ncbi:MAG: response regulator transcription factor [Phenylobacterium sp.]|nr:response regulator transcription factor [Phenylobacterium sp.]
MRGLICDDHPLMREALVAAMQDRWPTLVLDQASDYPAAWALAETGPDLCVVDLGMPGAGPLEGLAGVRSRAPDARLVAVTGLNDAGLLQAVREAGVAALVSKNAEPSVLMTAIADAAPELKSLEALRLPPRQQEVLALLAEGRTNKEIALRLGISPATVKIHVARLAACLGAANRTEAVANARRERLI